MTPATDSLEAALRAVPLRGYPSTTLPPISGHIPATQYEVDYPALAAAVREWIRTRQPEERKSLVWSKNNDLMTGYRAALADIAQMLGLEPSASMVGPP